MIGYLLLLIHTIYSIECWTCDHKSLTDCILFGGPRTCPGKDVSLLYISTGHGWYLVILCSSI